MGANGGRRVLSGWVGIAALALSAACSSGDRTFSEAPANVGGADSGAGGTVSPGGGGNGGGKGGGGNATGGVNGDASVGGGPGTGGAAGGGGVAGVDGGTGGGAPDAGGDGAAAPQGRPGMALVSGGTVMKSASYRLILTTGEVPGSAGKMKSSTYTLHDGVIGATQP